MHAIKEISVAKKVEISDYTYISLSVEALPARSVIGRALTTADGPVEKI